MVNSNVFFVTDMMPVLKCILFSLKGSDASWKNDQEPPVEVREGPWEGKEGVEGFSAKDVGWINLPHS